MGLKELLFSQTCCRNINKEIKTSKYIILQGIATHMLKEFKNYVRGHEIGVHRILLICKSKLIPLYTKAGFIFKCKSDVVHGTFSSLFTPTLAPLNRHVYVVEFHIIMCYAKQIWK